MSRPLRILMTADAMGGVWTYVVELAAALAGRGVEILLATMGREPSSEQRRELGAFTHVQLRTSQFKLEWMDEPWSDVDAAGDWLQELAAEFQPDVIHLNGYAHAALAWEAPVLVVAHSCVRSWWSAVKGEEAPERFAEYSERVGAGLRAADLVVAPTMAMLRMLRDEYPFNTEARVISNGRNASLFSPGEKAPLIFSAGRLWDEAKNVALLDRIAPDLAWRVHLAGAGERPQRNARVPVYVGELPTAVLAQHLAKAAIYAAPARYEPFGLGILEAALAGCALVLGDLPSLRENWEGAALFIDSADDDQWRTALNHLALDGAERGRLAAAAGARAARFSPVAMARAYEQTWRQLASAAAALCLS